ncbi:hypothetical protein GGF46_000249 [Coemansia sp. RSA 552]|nr:hypothetical protein GGF46_000249 [Coemansia sp. RSA 552]
MNKGKETQVDTGRGLQSVETLKAALSQNKEYRSGYQELQKTLSELPAEIEYEAMVPVGPLAFYPGKLINTNEILTFLGDGWFVEQSAMQAVGVAKRREELVTAKIGRLEAELGQRTRGDGPVAPLGAELGEHVLTEDGDRVVDIKEDLGVGEQPMMLAPSGLGEEEVPSIADEAALRAKRERMIRSLTEDAQVDRSQLADDDRALLEMLDTIEEEGSDDDDEAMRSGDERASDAGASSDDGRPLVAQSDDEDDFNDGRVMEEEEEVTPRRSASPAVGSPARSILKSPAPARSVQTPAKSVSFDPAAVAKSKPNEDSRMARLLAALTTSEDDEQPARPSGNTAAGRKDAGAKQQPLRARVIERAPATGNDDDGLTEDAADEDMHAHEIAQAYHHKRRLRMAAGKLDGAAAIAEQVLERTPNVKLVDATPGSTGSQEANDPVRIELQPDYSTDPDAPPEVLAAVPRARPAMLEDDPATQKPKPKMSRFKAQRLGL